MLLDVTELELKIHRNRALNENYLSILLMNLLLSKIKNRRSQSLHILIYHGVSMDRDQNFLSSTMHSNAVVMISRSEV